MTTTPTVAADRALRRRTLERRSASLALTGSTRWVLRRGIWWWLAFVFVFTVVTGRIASWTGSDEPFRITQALPLVLAFQAMSWWRGLLRVYVLAGGTRRSALLGGLIAAPVVGALFAAVQAAFTLVVSWSLGLERRRCRGVAHARAAVAAVRGGHDRRDLRARLGGGDLGGLPGARRLARPARPPGARRAADRRHGVAERVR